MSVRHAEMSLWSSGQSETMVACGHFLSVAREYDGFANPCGLRSRVVTVTGAGLEISTPVKPAPVAWV